MEVTLIVFTTLSVVASIFSILLATQSGRIALRANKLAIDAMEGNVSLGEIMQDMMRRDLEKLKTENGSLAQTLQALKAGAPQDLDLAKLPSDLPKELKEMLEAAAKNGTKVQFMKFPKNEDGECQCPDCTAERESNKEATPSQENLH